MSDHPKYTLAMLRRDLGRVKQLVVPHPGGSIHITGKMLGDFLRARHIDAQSDPNAESPYVLTILDGGFGALAPNPIFRPYEPRARRCKRCVGQNCVNADVCVSIHVLSPPPAIKQIGGTSAARRTYRGRMPTSDVPLIERIQSPGAAKRRARRLLKVATILLALGLFFTGTSQAQTVTSPTWDQELATARAQLAREGVTVAPQPPAHATETAHEHTLRWVLLGGEAAARIGDWASTSQAMRYKDNRYKEGFLPDGLAKSEPGLAAYEVGAWGAEAYISHRLARHHPKLAVAMDSVSLGMTGGMVIRDYDQLFNYHRP